MTTGYAVTQNNPSAGAYRLAVTYDHLLVADNDGPGFSIPLDVEVGSSDRCYIFLSFDMVF